MRPELSTTCFVHPSGALYWKRRYQRICGVRPLDNRGHALWLLQFRF